jgi:hypothetical protein
MEGGVAKFWGLLMSEAFPHRLPGGRLTGRIYDVVIFYAATYALGMMISTVGTR